MRSMTWKTQSVVKVDDLDSLAYSACNMHVNVCFHQTAVFRERINSTFRICNQTEFN